MSAGHLLVHPLEFVDRVGRCLGGDVQAGFGDGEPTDGPGGAAAVEEGRLWVGEGRERWVRGERGGRGKKDEGEGEGEGV